MLYTNDKKVNIYKKILEKVAAINSVSTHEQTSHDTGLDNV